MLRLYVHFLYIVNFIFYMDECESPKREWLQRTFLNQLSKYELLKKTLHLSFRYLRILGDLICDKMQEMCVEVSLNTCYCQIEGETCSERWSQ